MSSASLPDNEHERLLALYECDLLDTPGDPLFDSLTTLAAQVCDAPVALFSLIDQQRQWFKSNQGLPHLRQTSRDIAFCAHTILGTEILEVPDAASDRRFSDNPLVVLDPKIRFYAGMPLHDPSGFALGALCVMDFRPRRLTPCQLVALESLARLGVCLLEQRRSERKLAQRRRELAHMEHGLCRALERGEFLLHYQPKVSATTGKLCGAEALLRWRHPERGLIAPAQFVPILEETGLIIPVGLWVLETACVQMLRWEAAGIHVDSIGINLSARQCQQPQLAAHVRKIIDVLGLAAGRIELEITESMLMYDPTQALRTLNLLKESGVALAVDDFGTGYSGLSYLKQLPLDCLKIDRNFISNIPHDSRDVAIALAVIDLAHNLGLQVVAEGVETQAQAQFLAAHQCDFLQGFLFSRPLDADAYGRLEESWKPVTHTPIEPGVGACLTHDAPTAAPLAARALRAHDRSRV